MECLQTLRNVGWGQKALGLMLFSLAGVGLADTKVVDMTGHGDYLTIQDAVNNLPNPGPRTVIVRAGTYNESVTITNKNQAATSDAQRIYILADHVSPPGSVIVKPPQGRRAFVFKGSRYISLHALGITGVGKESEGAIILEDEGEGNREISIESCDIHDNASDAIVVEKENLGILLLNNLIRSLGGNARGKETSRGVGIRIKGKDGDDDDRKDGLPETVYTVNNTIFRTAKAGIEVGEKRRVFLVNNLVVDCGTDGKRKHEDGDEEDEDGRRGGGLRLEGGSGKDLILLSNLFYKNARGDLFPAKKILNANDSGNLTTSGAEGIGIAGSVFPGGDSTRPFTALFKDPLNATTPNFHQVPSSPSIDTGVNSFTDGQMIFDIISDLEGNPRPIDGDGDGIAENDIGCYEAPTPIAVAPDPNLDFGNVLVGANKNLNFTVTNQGAKPFSGSASITPGLFSLIGSPSYNLSPNVSTNLAVYFMAPTTYTGSFTNRVTFTGGGGATRSVTATTPVDGNNDGVPDLWEYKYFGTNYLNPTFSVNAQSPAGDGYTILQEYQKGRNPLDYYQGILPNLSIVSGNNQTATTNSFLSQPLTVQVSGNNGIGLSNAPVIFAMTQGGGLLSTSTNNPTLQSSLPLRANANGQVSAFLQLLGNPALTNLVSLAAVTSGQTNQVTFTELPLQMGIAPSDGLNFGNVPVASNGTLTFAVANQGAAPFSGNAIINGRSPLFTFTGGGTTNSYALPPNTITNLYVQYTAPTTYTGSFTNSVTFSGAGNLTRSLIATTPFNANGDGVSDVWKYKYFGTNYLSSSFSVTNQSPAGDGYTIAQEYQLRRNPLDYYQGVLPNMKITGGNNQMGITNAFLPQPLLVQLTGTNGVALANAPVTLNVTQGSSLLAASTNNSTLQNSLNLRADTNGNVSTFLQLLGDPTVTNLVSVAAVTGNQTNQVTLTELPTQIGVSPNSNLDFASVVVGALKQLPFTVTNQGAATLNGNAVFLNTNGLFSIIGPSSFTLPLNASTNIMVQYTAPTTYTGSFTNLLTFTGGGGATRTVTATTPFNSNNDGVSDVWKYQYFGTNYLNSSFSVNNPSPAGDGHTIAQEYQLGRNPLDYYQGTLPTLSKISGDNQVGTTNSFLPQPLVVQLTGVNGSALVNAPLTFNVAQGSGFLATSTNNPLLQSTLNLRSDANGQVSSFLLLPSSQNSTNLVSAVATSGTSSTQVAFTEVANGGATQPPTTGLSLWLEANQGTVTNSTGQVTSWMDQSGNNNNATQANLSTSPLWVSNVINGKPVVRFNGNNNALSIPSASNLITGTNSFTVACVHIRRNTNINNFLAWTVPSSDNNVQIVDDGGNSGIWGHGSWIFQNPHGTSIGQPYVTTFVRNGNTWKTFVNFAPTGSNVTDSRSLLTPSSPYYIGRVGGGPVQYLNGDIAEILVYNGALSPTDQASLANYLQQKYQTVIPPSAPSNFSAIPISSTQASLLWNDAGTQAAGIRIERKTGSGNYAAIATVNAGMDAYIDAGLAPGATYAYRILAQNMIGNSSYSNELSVTTPSTGPALPVNGMAIWLRADAGVITSQNSVAVSQWMDGSGNHNNAMTADYSNAPFVVSNGMNGKPVVRFYRDNGNSPNEALSIPSASNLITGTNSFTMFCVHKRWDSSINNLLSWTVNDSDNNVQIFEDGINSAIWGHGSAVLQNPHGTTVQTQNYSTSVLRNGNLWRSYINGAQTGSDVTDSRSMLTPTSPYYIGTLASNHDAYNASQFMNGDIAEMIIYHSALSDSDRLAVENYLNQKYALQVTPGVPTNLSATPISTSQVSLVWTDTTNPPFKTLLERKMGSGGTYAQIASLNGNTDAYLDTGLLPNTTYFYRVRSQNQVGTSNYSSEVSVTTQPGGADLPVNGLVLWNRSDGGITADSNNNVTQWTDSSGNGNNGTLGEGATAPLLRQNILDGKISLDFSGNAYLDAGNNPSLTYSNLSYFVVASFNNAANNQALMSKDSGSGSANKWIYWYSGGSMNFSIQPGAANAPSTAFTPVARQMNLFELTKNNATYIHYMNGANFGSSVNGTPIPTINSNFLIGQAENRYFLNGNISEILVFNNALSDADRQAVESYLVRKYGPPAPTSLMANAVSANEIDLSWAASAGEGISYLVERKTGAQGTYAQIATVGVGVTSYADTGVSPLTAYTYRVRATNPLGASGYSNEASAMTTDVLPSAPSALSATAISSSRIDLAWTGNSTNGTGFKIERQNTAGGPFALVSLVGASVTTYSDTGLQASTLYSYRVRATNAVGDSPNSNIASATTAADSAPAAPGNLLASAVSSSEIDLAWTSNSTNETGFKIERKTGSGGTYAQIALVGTVAASFKDTGVLANTPYFYRVRATNPVGDSSYSNEASASTSDSIPAAPTGLSAQPVASSQVRLSWSSNSSNATSFVVERKIGSSGAYQTIATLGANTNSFTDSGLTVGTTYVYRVHAVNGAGSSGFSNESSATPFLDTNGSGLPDAWQMQYFGHLGVDPNALTPAGITNLQAYLTGQDPTKSNSADINNLLQLLLYDPFE